MLLPRTGLQFQPVCWLKQRRGGAFTLIEALIASGAMALFVLVCVSSIVFDQVAIRKAKEHQLVMDFLTHYAETIKAQPFTSIMPGSPINYLYSGANGTATITFPVTNGWVSITNNNYQLFDPDLLWIANRHPQMLVSMNSNTVAGVPEIDINLRVDWDAPLQRGGRLEVQLDVLRSSDL